MIQLGLLWFDDDPRRPLAQKVDLAVRRFRERLGRTPDVCQLHPTQAAALVAQKTTDLPPLRLVPDATLRPNYFLVGTEDEAASVEPAWAAALEESQEAVASRRDSQPSSAGTGRKRGRAAASRAIVATAHAVKPERIISAAKFAPTTASTATAAAASQGAATAVAKANAVRARPSSRTTVPVASAPPRKPARRAHERAAPPEPAPVRGRSRHLAIVQALLPLDTASILPEPAAPRKRRNIPPAVPPAVRSGQRTRGRATATDSGPGTTGDPRDLDVAPRPRTRESSSRLPRQKPATPAEPSASEAHPRRHRHAS